jgi:hypothetical protein
VKNDGYDNEDSDYILYVNDILGSEEAGHKYAVIDPAPQGPLFANATQESVPDFGCSRARHVWSGCQVPKFEDTGSCCRQGHQEPDSVLQPEYDGGFGSRLGKMLC